MKSQWAYDRLCEAVKQSKPSLVLAKFQQLYDIEDCGKTLSADDRLVLRQNEARPVWSALSEWLDSPAAKEILPKSRFGQALGYLRNQWDALQLYLTDGHMPIDNNSAVRNDLDVWAYLKDILDRLLAGETDYQPMRPDI